jgi:hypothetical protein
MAILTLVLYVPVLRDLFNFGMLHANDIALCFGAGASCILWFEIVKFFSRPKENITPVINNNL